MIGELRTIIRRDGSYERFEGLQQTEGISTDEAAVGGDIDEARYTQFAVGYSSAMSAADRPGTFAIVSSGSPDDVIVFAFFLFSSRAP